MGVMGDHDSYSNKVQDGATVQRLDCDAASQTSIALTRRGAA